jgi:hypothetical protein
MKLSDPASLQNLNDIVLPATIGWWPLATGWYVLIGFMLIVIAWFSYRSLKLWIKNRYRRAALRELQLLEDRVHQPGQRDASLRQIPVLLKRTALAVYPRSQVASLTGKDWFYFLNSTAKKPSFTENTTNTLNVVSYSTGELSEVDLKAMSALINASRSWLKHHQAITVPKDVMET